jgi:hypothetical protein
VRQVRRSDHRRPPPRHAPGHLRPRPEALSGPHHSDTHTSFVPFF